MSCTRLNVLLHVTQTWRRGEQIPVVEVWENEAGDEMEEVGSEADLLTEVAAAAAIGTNGSDPRGLS